LPSFFRRPRVLAGSSDHDPWQAVADVVEHAARDGSVLVVLGGDCTITLGVLAGLHRVSPVTGALITGLAGLDGLDR
jgi:arginase family enzyme